MLVKTKSRSKDEDDENAMSHDTPSPKKLVADNDYDEGDAIVHHSSGKKGCKRSLSTGEEYGSQAAGHDWTAAGAGKRGECKVHSPSD